jgi:hypothetical protein
MPGARQEEHLKHGRHGLSVECKSWRKYRIILKDVPVL